MRRTMLLSLLFVVFLSQETQGQTCANYTGSLCSSVISYYPGDQKLIYQGKTTQETLELTLLALGYNNLTKTGPVFLGKCYHELMKFTCSTSFASCFNSGNLSLPLFPCRDVCESYVSSCASLFTTASPAPNCSLFLTSNCNSLSAFAYDTSNLVCPDPLIKNPDESVPHLNCALGGCCYKCPAIDGFYPPGVFFAYQMSSAIISAISSLLTLFIGITYLVMREKKSYGQHIITSMAFALTIAFGSNWITFINGRVNTFCDDPVNQARAPDVNHACIVQGTFWAFGSLSSVMWFAVMCINVHLVVFWRVSITRYINYGYHFFCWTAPLAVIIAINAYDQGGYISAMGCVTPKLNWLNGTLVIPTGCFAIGSLLLNCITFGYVTNVSRKTKASIKSILKLQYRPLLYTFSVLISFVISWAFIQTSGKVGISNWILEWQVCIAEGKGQKECSIYSAPNLLDLSAYFASYIFSSLIGLAMFVSFGLKREVLMSWRKIFGGRLFSTVSEDKSTTTNIDRTISDLSQKQTETELK